MDHMEQESDKWYRFGWKLMEEGSYLQSIKAFDRVIHENVEFREAYFARGVCHYKLGSYHSTACDMKAAAILGYEPAVLWSCYGWR